MSNEEQTWTEKLRNEALLSPMDRHFQLSREEVLALLNGPWLSLGNHSEGARFREDTIIVRTHWDYVGTVTTEAYSEAMGTISRRALNTSERQVREALVAMGWTPPAR